MILSTNSHASKMCQFTQPNELEVMYDNSVPFSVSIFNEDKEMSSQNKLILKVNIELDGSVVTQATCPSRFMLKGLGAGMHSISIILVSQLNKDKTWGPIEKLRSPNRTFFVAHEMFRPGRPWRPVMIDDINDMYGTDICTDEDGVSQSALVFFTTAFL